MSTLTDRLKPEAAEYAARLMTEGFTVYVEANPRHPGTLSAISGWFHYSRTDETGTYFGTFHDGSDSFDGPNHSMPIEPTRLNGSSATIGGTWGDAPTLNLDNLAPDSIEYAQAVARPFNWCPLNAEPTRDAVNAASRDTGTPSRYYRGARLANFKPWGIGTVYVEATQ